MEIGKRFVNYTEVKAAMKAYADEHFISFYVRDDRTVDAAKRKVKRYIDDSIEMYQVKFCCLKGGKKFESEGTGQRATNTYQDDCPAFIRFTASRDGKALEISAKNANHNHPMSKAIYDHLPGNRALADPSTKNEAIELLALGANKKLVKKKMERTTGRLCLLKDLSNAASSLRPTQRNDLDQVAKLIEDEYGAEYHIATDGDTFKGLLITSEAMKRTMAAYPEFIGIDATYKLTELRTPVVVMHVEDSNGNTETVCVAVLTDELLLTASTMKWLLQKFKEVYPSWTEIRCIMADKDLQERDLLKEYFPVSKVLICSFHTLRTFRREVSCMHMGITSSERDHALGLLQQMVMTRSEETFKALENEFDATVPAAVKGYYDRNWRGIKDDWQLGPEFTSDSFNNTTNNRLESLNGKLKSVIKRHSSLEDFVSSLFAVLKSLSDERDHRAVSCIYKRPCAPATDEATREYQNALTPYAFKYVKAQLSDAGKLEPPRGGNDVYHYKSSCGETRSTATDCSCPFRRSMHLPCKHMFATRRLLNITGFEDTLYAERWSKEYYFTHQRLFNRDKENQPPHSSVSSVPTTKPAKALSAAQKYRTVLPTCKYLAQLVSEETGDKFQERVHVLMKLSKAWEVGASVDVVEILSGVVPDQAERSGAVQVSTGSTVQCDARDFADVALNIAEDTPTCPHSNPEGSSSGNIIPCTGQVVDLSTVSSPAGNIMTSATQPRELSVVSSLTKENTTGLAAPPKELPAANSPTEENTAGTAVQPEELPAVRSPSVQFALQAEVLPTVSSHSSEARTMRLKNITLPPRIKLRGRPKGATTTVIGLPRKKAKKKVKGLVPFKDLPVHEKEKKILKCFVEDDVAMQALQHGTLIDEDLIETIPSRIPDMVVDTSVNIDIVKRYFTKDGWVGLKATVNTKRKCIQWRCAECRDLLDNDPAIICESCLLWFHQECSTVTKRNLESAEPWFCTKCQKAINV